MQTRGSARLSTLSIGYALARMTARSLGARWARTDDVASVGLREGVSVVKTSKLRRAPTRTPTRTVPLSTTSQATWRRRQIAAGHCGRCGRVREHYGATCDACRAALGGKPLGTHRRRLTEDVVVAVRERYAAGETLRALALDVGTSAANVSLIVHGMTWTWTGGPIAGTRAAGDS